MTGLEAATGDFVIQVDSDDWAEQDYIKRLVETAVEEDADVVYCDFFKEYPKKNKVYREGDFTPSTGPVAAKCMHNSIIRGYMWNKLERRSLYDLSSMFIPRHGYHEDLVFQTQALCKADKVFHLKEPLYHYRRRRKGALTAGSLIKTHRQSSENMLLFYDALPKDGVTLKACGIDILLRGGWYCACTLDFKLLREHPDAVKALLEADYVRGGRVPVSKQRFTKFICRLLRIHHAATVSTTAARAMSWRPSCGTVFPRRAMRILLLRSSITFRRRTATRWYYSSNPYEKDSQIL